MASFKPRRKRELYSLSLYMGLHIKNDVVLFSFIHLSILSLKGVGKNFKIDDTVFFQWNISLCISSTKCPCYK